MDSKASAVWEGGLKDGAGRVSTASGSLKSTPYTFKNRFEGQPGATPEEMIGAAHAGCYSMALSAILAADGMTPERISTDATITLEKVGDGFEVTKSHLSVRARIAGGDAAAFKASAEKAKDGCPISKLLKAKITLDATLET